MKGDKLALLWGEAQLRLPYICLLKEKKQTEKKIKEKSRKGIAWGVFHFDYLMLFNTAPQITMVKITAFAVVCLFNTWL